MIKYAKFISEITTSKWNNVGELLTFLRISRYGEPEMLVFIEEAIKS